MWGRGETTTLSWYQSHERRIWSVGSFLGVFVVWELASVAGAISMDFLTSPSAIFLAGVHAVGESEFWGDVGVSTLEFTAGYIAAVVLGIPFGLAIGWYRRVAYAFEPMLNFLYATPRIALLPLIVLMLGIAVASKIAVVFLGAWVTILLNTYLGVRTVEPRFTAVASAFGASQARLFTSVVFPSSIPFILAGMRLGIGRALIGVVVGEFFASSAGIGYMIKTASTNYQLDRMFFAIALLIVMGLAAVAAIQWLSRVIAPWRVDALAE